MTGVLYGLARFCARRRFVVLGVWLLLTFALVGVSHRLGDNTNDNLTLPGTDSQRATDTLTKSFPNQANGSSPIVLHAKSGKLTDSKYSNAVNQAAADVAKSPDVASVVNPLTSQGASALSKDQATGYLSVTLSVSPGALSSMMPRRSSTRRPILPRRRGSRSRPAASLVRKCPSRRQSPAS
ncbi:MAG: MMPL family transporter [Solirubrobacteraceae bacterium]